MSFSTHTSVKVIRTTYIVGFYEGSTAQALLEDIQRLPRAAKLIEVQEPPDRDYGSSHFNGQYTLTFECEQPIGEPVKEEAK